MRIPRRRRSVKNTTSQRTNIKYGIRRFRTRNTKSFAVRIDIGIALPRHYFRIYREMFDTRRGSIIFKVELNQNDIVRIMLSRAYVGRIADAFMCFGFASMARILDVILEFFGAIQSRCCDRKLI